MTRAEQRAERLRQARERGVARREREALAAQRSEAKRLERETTQRAIEEGWREFRPFGLPGAAWARVNAGASVVYIVEAAGVDRCKVGWTTNYALRMRDLQAGSPLRLYPLELAFGTRALEHRLHRRWAAHRLHGEWFTLAVMGDLPARTFIERDERDLLARR